MLWVAFPFCVWQDTCARWVGCIHSYPGVHAVPRPMLDTCAWRAAPKWSQRQSYSASIPRLSLTAGDMGAPLSLLYVGDTDTEGKYRLQCVDENIPLQGGIFTPKGTKFNKKNIRHKIKQPWGKCTNKKKKRKKQKPEEKTTGQGNQKSAGPTAVLWKSGRTLFDDPLVGLLQCVLARIQKHTVCKSRKQRPVSLVNQDTPNPSLNGNF